jgi:hypothetical protein
MNLYDGEVLSCRAVCVCGRSKEHPKVDPEVILKTSVQEDTLVRFLPFRTLKARAHNIIICYLSLLKRNNYRPGGSLRRKKLN